ncbi:MAG: PAS domain-containing protein [Alphaproteobacteria bacterium]|nr:PAS domain-containing protein [Alphaproteobacteria bacterium]
MLEIHAPSLGIRNARLQRLLADWEARRHGREFPARADFTPHDFRYLIGNLSLLDVLYEPLRFRYRVHASNLAQRMGAEMTGKWIDEIPNPRHAAAARSHFAEVIERRAPVVYRRDDQFVTDNLPHDCEVLALPLARDGRTIDMLMSAFVWAE